MAGNVNLIDPNESNINFITQNDKKVYQHNGAPPYEDMFISVNLTAKTRERTVLITNPDANLTRVDSSTNNGTKISFLGENQNPNSSNYNRFTTNYYDGSTNDPNVQYEGFGISNIKITTNSSYIPQIDIEFVDVRGLSFFNKKDSPYKVLFNFPPPIFELTIKGYYGKAISYQMHLVKYNSEFKADTGNFHIDANFIAITYAPLTDVLFRYIVQAPLLPRNNNVDSGLNPESDERPKNTLDLILKLQKVYSSLPEKIKTDLDNRRYERSRSELNLINDKINGLGNIRSNKILTESEGNNPIFFTVDNVLNSSSDGKINTFGTLSTFNDTLSKYSTFETPKNINPRLYVGYDTNISGDDIDIINNITRNNLLDVLTRYRNEFLFKNIGEFSFNVSEEDIPQPRTILSRRKGSSKENNDITYTYVGLDITNYYTKLYKEKLKATDNKSTSSDRLNQKINNMIQQNLGMRPTIYNIFSIILNDVDKFFQILKDTAILAQEHHSFDKYGSQIVNDGNYKDSENEIYAFPLVIREEKICNSTKQVRAVPYEISDKLDQPFPEIVLVHEFIDSFIEYNRVINQARLRVEQKANGDYTWIPFTPIDSEIVSGNQGSPYYGVDPINIPDGDQAINFSNETKLNQIFRIFLTRYYVLSQYVIPFTYSNLNTDGYYDSQSKDAYIDLFAESEAINLVNSIKNTTILDLLERYSNLNKGSTALNNTENGFYSYLSNQLLDTYNLPESPEFLDISNGESLYLDKTNPEYSGLSFLPNEFIAERTGNENGDDPINDFVESSRTTWIDRIFRGKDKSIISNFIYTQDNIVYRPDNPEESFQFNGNSQKTKFLLQEYALTKNNDGEITFGLKATQSAFSNISKRNYLELINGLSENGNKYFYDQNIDNSARSTNNIYRDIVVLLARNLSLYGNDIYDTIINIKNIQHDEQQYKLIAIVYLSLFGNALSPFNVYPYNLNKDYFSTPSIVEIPEFVRIYLGALVGIEKDDDFYNILLEFFSTGDGSNIDNGGCLIFGDIYDVNNNLSENDREEFRIVFSDFFNDGPFRRLANLINNFYDNIIDGNAYSECDSETCIRDLFISELESNYSNIISTFYTPREGLVVYNEITFRLFDNLEKVTYTSLSELNDNQSLKDTNDKYFTQFFNKVNSLIDERKQELKQQEEEFKRSTGDKDITNQMYYSLKNINDKWLAGLNKNSTGYPFKNEPKGNLIDQFVFVDRAMKPIGDTIINPEILTEVLDSPDISIFTVISQLLSLNGFEFFPLQNFLSFTEGDWRDSFKIDTGVISKQFPMFVCMYIGGSSSYPSGINDESDFIDDGIIDLNNPGVPDFSGDRCPDDEENDPQITSTYENESVFNQVRAFKVKYGEQNQSMFYDVKIDSKEYPETNESIQILSRLAGDNKENAPVPKGQNLYNLFENRSYRATITGLGNAMIQPTQYFQLENVPLFNGAYVILSVEHDIVPNKMTTTFSGTKILKYPVPRVLDPASIIGFDGGSSTETNISELANQDILAGVGTGNNPPKAQKNSLYTFEIR